MLRVYVHAPSRLLLQCKPRLSLQVVMAFLLYSLGANAMGVNGGVGLPSDNQQASLLQDTMMHLNVNSQG